MCHRTATFCATLVTFVVMTLCIACQWDFTGVLSANPFYFQMADMKKQAFALSFASKLVVLAAHELRYGIMLLHGDKLATFSIVMTSHVIVMTLRILPTEHPVLLNAIFKWAIPVVFATITNDRQNESDTTSACNVHLQGGARKKKVKCILVQALRLCTGRTAHRRSRGIALLFHDQRH